MRKNKMMRLASGLLVAVLLTTSTISGTFAKYVTSDSASDTARVAKWGVTVMASGNLFGTDYESNSADTNKDSIVAATSVNVSSTDGNIVAPGTRNFEGFKIAINGTPEVAYTITATDNGKTIEDIFLLTGKYGVMVKATGLNAATTDLTGYYTLDTTNNIYIPVSGAYVSGTPYYELHDEVTLTSDYYPINWSVANTGNATAITATDKNLNTISSEIKAGIVAGTHNAKSDSAASYTLTWEWPIEKNNQADTILGNLMVGTIENAEVVWFDASNSSYKKVPTEKYNLDIVYGLEVTVTQVD